MLKIEYTKRMRQDVKRLIKRGKDFSKLKYVLNILAAEEVLSAQHKDHKLTGDKSDFRECHIEPNWLLMYKIIENELILSATASGTHSDLFDM